MFEKLAFSIDIVLPIFLVMVLGYFLKRIDFFEEDASKKLSRLLYYVIMPISLFKSIWRTDLSRGFPLKFSLLLIFGIVLTAFLAYMVGRMIKLTPKKLGAFAHGSFRGNYVYIGMSIMAGMGILDRAALEASIVIIINMLLYIPIAIIMLSGGEERRSLKDLIKAVLKTPS